MAKTVGVLSPAVGRSEECAQEFAPQSHIHSGLNQQDLVPSFPDRELGVGAGVGRGKNGPVVRGTGLLISNTSRE